MEFISYYPLSGLLMGGLQLCTYVVFNESNAEDILGNKTQQARKATLEGSTMQHTTKWNRVVFNK